MRDGRRARALAACVLALGCSWVSAADVDSSLRKASGAYDAGRIEQALTAYEALAVLHVDSPTVHAGIAAAASRLGRYGRAIQAYHRAIDLSPADATLMGDLANAYLRVRRLHAAKEWYGRALSTTPNPANADSCIGLGIVATQEADFPTAAAWFQRAIAADPSSARAYHNLGLARLKQNRLDAADVAFIAAIERGGGVGPALFARGQIAMRRKDWTRAMPLLEGAICRQPDPTYLYALSQVQFRLGMREAGRESVARFREARAGLFYEEGHSLLGQSEWKAALGWLERALALEPTRTEALRDRAHCLLQLGDAEGARRGYQAMLRQDPTSVHATYYLGVAQLCLSDREAAEARFVQTVQRAPGFADGYRQLALARELRGDLAGAEKALTQGIERDSTWSAGHWLRGMIRNTRERWSGAEADFRKSIGLTPDEVHPRQALATLLAERGRNLHEALALARGALSVAPTAESRAILALVLHHMDDRVGARREILRAVGDAPDNEVVQGIYTQIVPGR